MRILGIDPGLQNTGWGVIESQANTLRFLACGRVRTDGSMDVAARLAVLDRGLEAVLKAWSPDEAAVEQIFVNANPASAMKLGLARGVALCVPARAGLAVAEYPANTVKKSIVGAGHAAKVQIAAMVRMLLPASGTTLSADEADALAIAICHAHHSASRSLLRAAAQK
ncbi:MAG TPA: crossover junction endodeoxyribonuclease RuvC [Alphaproteobacteria bacterium]|nr:crossover junction endodeoxyribonuclease RuvC [Alphaproteobacteria bacterium]